MLIPKWTDANGKETPVNELESNHMINIVKFCMTMNKMPANFIMKELQLRGMLPRLAERIIPEDGYQSPSDIYAAQFDYDYLTLDDQAAALRILEAMEYEAANPDKLVD